MSILKLCHHDGVTGTTVKSKIKNITNIDIVKSLVYSRDAF